MGRKKRARGGNCKDKRSYEKNRLTETHKDRVGRNLSANQSGNKLYERERQVQRDEKQKENQKGGGVADRHAN